MIGMNITKHKSTVVLRGQEVPGILEAIFQWCSLEPWGPIWKEISHGHRHTYEFTPDDKAMVDVLDGQPFTLKKVENVTTQDIECEGVNIDGDAIVLEVNGVSVFGVDGIGSVLDNDVTIDV